MGGESPALRPTDLGAQAEFRKSDNPLLQRVGVADLLEASLTEIHIFDALTLRFLHLNQGALRNLGYSLEQALELTPLDLQPEWTPASFARWVEPLRKGQKSILDFETVHRRADGSHYPVEVHLQFFERETGPVFLAMVLDISERRQADAALREREERLRFALEGTTDGIWDWDVQTGQAYFSPRYYTMLGYEPGDFPACYDSWHRLLHPDDVAEAEAVLARQFAAPSDGFAMEFRLRSKTGEWRWILGRGKVVSRDAAGKPVRVAGSHSDVTERKRTEEALRVSEARFSKAFHTSPDAVAINRLADGAYLEINQGFTALTGFTLDEVRGKTSTELGIWVNPEDRNRLIRELQTQREVVDLEALFRGKDGRVRTGLMSASCTEVNGELCILSFTRDITARQQSEQALRESEFFLRRSQSVARLGSYRFDAALGRWTSSPMLDEIFGIADDYPRDIAGWLALVHPQHRAEMGDYLRRHVLTERCRFDREYRIVRPKDGQERWVHGMGELEFDAAGHTRLMIGTIQDITERKCGEEERRKLQNQLIQAQKMEAVGHLAGGVAHDFNNILAAIMLQVGVLQTDPKLTPEIRSALSELEAEAARAASLTRQLLLFSRRQVVQPQVLNLTALLDNLLKMLRRLIGEHIQLEFKGSAEPLWVKADPGMIEQVIMNLVVNARDAMPEGGRLTLGTASVLLAEAEVGRHPEGRAGHFACLRVEDTGCGIELAVLDRIFEPFFTTKEVGKGTGLGLATVYGIVKQHEGWVEVESTVGQGSSFRIFLPAHGAAPSPHTPQTPEAARGGSETLLVVEDESTVRASVVRLLQQHGYQVLVAENGGQAIELWSQAGSKVDLLLTDMVMPGGLTGLELAKTLQRDCSGLRVIVMSGYNPELAHQSHPALQGIVYLQKPFTGPGLAKAVRDCLDAK